MKKINLLLSLLVLFFLIDSSAFAQYDDLPDAEDSKPPTSASPLELQRYHFLQRTKVMPLSQISPRFESFIIPSIDQSQKTKVQYSYLHIPLQKYRLVLPKTALDQKTFYFPDKSQYPLRTIPIVLPQPLTITPAVLPKKLPLRH